MRGGFVCASFCCSGGLVGPVMMGQCNSDLISDSEFLALAASLLIVGSRFLRLVVVSGKSCCYVLVGPCETWKLVSTFLDY